MKDDILRRQRFIENMKTELGDYKAVQRFLEFRLNADRWLKRISKYICIGTISVYSIFLGLLYLNHDTTMQMAEYLSQYTSELYSALTTGGIMGAGFWYGGEKLEKITEEDLNELEKIIEENEMTEIGGENE